jgi:hypothetical protein
MKNIIYQPWGGLGDNLAHSIIPKLCYEQGIKCFLSKQNAYRNQEIFDFVWKTNPYIEKKQVDFTDLSWLDTMSTPGFNEKGVTNQIEAIQKAYGFKVKYHYPKIYYTPKKIKTAIGKTVIDLSAYSIRNEYNFENILKILHQFNLDTNTLALTHSGVNYGVNYKTEYNCIDINDLQEYSDLLFSCKRFITLHSGQACLASTIKFQTNCDIEIYVLTLNKFLPKNTCGYTFKNTEYISCD